MKFFLGNDFDFSSFLLSPLPPSLCLFPFSFFCGTLNVAQDPLHASICRLRYNQTQPKDAPQKGRIAGLRPFCLGLMKDGDCRSWDIERKECALLPSPDIYEEGGWRPHRRRSVTREPQLLIRVDERGERQGPTIIRLPPSHTEDLE